MEHNILDIIDVPIGISTTTRLPTTSAVQWRPMDYGNPVDRDPTYDYAPPAIERVRFVSEVRGGGRHPTARANSGMLGMYSRPSPVIVPAPWAGSSHKRNNIHIRGRVPAHHQHQLLQQGSVQHQQHLPPPPPPRGALPLWKLLSHKRRPRRPSRPVMRPAVVNPSSPVRFIGQDPAHPLYHHQVFQDEAEVFQHIPNIVYFQPTDVKHAKKNNQPTSSKIKPSPGLKPGSVANAALYSAESSSASEFRPVRPTSVPTVKKVTQGNRNHHGGNKDYKFTVVGYHGPAATTPMSPVAPAPQASTNRPPTVLYAVKTTPETLSTTHNSAVKPLEPTESLEPHDGGGEEFGEASELRPVHVLPDETEVQVDGREQGGVDVDFENSDDDDNSSGAPQPVVPNSFNVFESLLSSFEKEFGGNDDGADEEEIEEVKDNNNQHNHRNRNPVFSPADEALDTQETTTATSAKNSFETSTSVSVSVGVSSHSSSSKSSSSSSSSQANMDIEDVISKLDEEDDGGSILDEIFAIRTAPTTARPTTATTTSTTTEMPVTTASTTEPSTTTTTTEKTRTSTAYPRLPTMPTYKRKPTPVYSRKSSKAGGLLHKYSSSSSSSFKEVTATGGVPNGSGEVVIITAGRSKVKEYKPQVIANQTHLLAFDKVVAPEGEGAGLTGVMESPILVESNNASPVSTSTTKSPLEDFDAMQLLHSWLNKA